MPSRNRIKIYAVDTYYHIYNRGVERRDIFVDGQDYRYFLKLLQRYLSSEPQKDEYGREYTSYHDRLEVNAFCLMPNHLHFFIYQQDETAMKEFWQRLMTAYVSYFNRKYKRVGGLFQDRFKAKHVMDEAYLWHITRYIHLNPTDVGRSYVDYPYSSYRYYIGSVEPDWLHVERVKDIFQENGQSYAEFVQDGLKKHKLRKEISQELAD